MTQKMDNMVNSFAIIRYRFILGIKRLDRVPNDIILKRVNRQPLINKLYTIQLRTLGHWLRAKENLISKFALYTPTHGKNRRGRPRLTYVKKMEKITKLTVEELKDLAKDSTEWRRRIVGLYDTHPPD